MQLDPSVRTVRGGLRKRALEACTFCRQRKIKCDNTRPICSSCKTHKRNCLYDRDPSELPPKQRTTASHRSRTGLAADEDDGNASSRSRKRARLPTPDETTIDRDRPISRILVSDGRSTYHGQTSALFDLQDSTANTTSDASRRLPNEYVRKGLLAEAAIQRQMEAINYASGSLDFDGVDPELGMHLLSLHWNRQHHSFLITYRPAFMRDMMCNGPYFSKILLNAIYFGAAKFSPRLEVRKDPEDVRTAGWKYRERVRELLGSSLDRSEITTIQALLVMANSLFALGNERSAAWLYSGLAFRMIIDLGLHSEVSTIRGIHSLTDEDIEIRRRVFWGAFVVDKIQSLYHGRLPSLQQDDASVPIEFLDLYEENEQWQPFAYHKDSTITSNSCPAYSVSTFSALCKLAIIMNSILNQLYADKILDCSTADLSRMAEKLQSSLDSWLSDLPPHLRFEPSQTAIPIPPPHVFSLMAMYDVLLILLHRPFVADGHLYRNARSVSVNSLRICVTAANRVVDLLKAYHQAFSIQRAPYLISYATYVSATIHVRVAAQRGPDSEAHMRLKTALSVLEVNQGTNWAAKRAKLIVEGLAKRLNVTTAHVEDELNGDRSERELPRIASYKPTEGVVASFSSTVQRSRAPETTSFPIDVQTQGEAEMMGFSPSFDIDAVIQSFATGNVSKTIAPTASIDDMNRDLTSQRKDCINERRLNDDFQDIGVSAPTDQLSQQQTIADMDRWAEQWEFSAQLTDDVLFGFNSSATDGLYYQDSF